MTKTQSYDWSRFEIFFYYDQPVEEVFLYWTTAAGLEAFFIEKAYFASKAKTIRSSEEVIEKGDRYRWEWRQNFSLEGDVLNVKNNEEITFTFGEMEVSLLFSKRGEQTQIHLLQTKIPDTDDGRVFGHLNCRSCWIFFLTNLKSVLDKNHDLRDSSPERVSSMEVGFKPITNRD